MKIFSVIGFHRSGKTTAVENLITYIKSKGKTVSSIKDIHNENFTMEKKGSNSQRHLIASDSCVFARGIAETYLIWNKQLNLKEMLEHIDTEWLIVEGMREERLPKMISARKIDDLEELFDDTVFAITGPISEEINEYKGIPVLNAQKNIDLLGELVLKNIPSIFINDKKTQTNTNSEPTININFDGENIYLNDWVKGLALDLIESFCKNLKGYEEGNEIEIKIIFNKH